MSAPRSFHSLAERLGRAVVGAVLIALVVGTGLTTWTELSRYADDKRDSLRAVASVFASASGKAAAAGDAIAVERALRAIAEQRNVVYGALILPDGSLLAEQGLGLRLSDDLDLDRSEGVTALALAFSHTVRLTVPVIDSGQQVGRILLVAETADLRERLIAVLLNAALAASLALAVGFAVSWRLQKALTRPLIALADTMEAVRLNHDYAQLAPVTTNDEVGALARTFNGLLGAVRERDGALAEHRASLERQVGERTADLREAKDAAESANAAKSSFLATMSHEIRTPMNGMLVMAELLAAGDLPQRQRRYAEVIARSGQSLLAIINDILDFAKVEAGKMELEHIPVVTGDLVDTVVTLFGERARAKGLDLAACVAPGVPRVFAGDPVRLGQVLGNFVNNALKFTESGHVLVRIAPRDEGRAIEISVTDTGIGIPADKLPTIFSAFSQADQSTTRRFGGTGLGLSIAQSLVAAMGGEIGVTSEPGRGSTFFARLPVETLAADEPVSRGPEIAAAFLIGEVGAAGRIVLAETLAAAGFAPGSETSDDETSDGEAPGAHRLLRAEELVRRGSRPAQAGRILALAPMGDPSGAQALRLGLADEVLRWPLVQAEWRPALAALASGAPFAAASAPPETEAAPPRFAGARVLVADDNAVNREVAVEALSRCGVSDVATVEDGRAAVEAVRTGRFDLVLMDGSMPVLDGFDAARAIRDEEAASGAPRLPIYALTAHVVGTAADAWQAAGMDGVLAKPFTLADLTRVLATALAGAEPREEAPVETQQPRPAEPESEALLDSETLAALSEMAEGGSSAFLERLLRLFREHAPNALAALREALAAGEAPAAARAAHSLKSMSVNVGATALSRRLAEIERLARVEEACAGEEMFAEIAALLPASLDALGRHFETRLAA